MSKKDDDHYQLVVVSGGVEPSLFGEIAETWEDLEKTLLQLLKTSDYDEAEDGVFFLTLSKGNKLKDIGAFSGGYMDEMRKKAGIGVSP